MSTDIKATQITLSDEGQICYQPQDSNPLPGEAVATLTKGDSLFAPSFAMLDGAPLSQEHIAAALTAHLQENLSVFVKLPLSTDLPAPVQTLCQALYDHAGMAPREALQDGIAQLDPDMRTALRNKGVRLGPLYAYCPDMNKPAPLRLRALLWGLYHGMDLPVTRIPDGMVSKRVDTPETPLSPQQADLYKALCYPVYGGRAIRIDMLDRVVNAIYESADKGKFQAQHAMAEWMGCPIAELYHILESLGHKKIYDPADEAKEDDGKKEEGMMGDAPQTEAPKPENIKPELATFQLKRGKAYQQGGERADKKPFKKKDKPAFKKDNKKAKGKKPKDQGPRVISAPAKTVADSPFAVLGQLKK